MMLGTRLCHITNRWHACTNNCDSTVDEFRHDSTTFKRRNFNIIIINILIGLLLLTTGCQNIIGLKHNVTSAELKTLNDQVLRESLESPDPIIRVHAFETLALMNDPAFYPAMRDALDDPVPAIRFAAALALGDVKDQAAKPRLEQLTQDENTTVKLGAGYALEKLGSPYFKDWYDNVLFGSDEKLAGLACVLLGRLGNTPLRSDSNIKLWNVMRRPNQFPTVRLQAAEALARLQDRSVLKQLMVFANRYYVDDRLLAVAGLRHLSGPDVFAMLSVLADDDQLEVRITAIHALGPLADDDQFALVCKSLTYKDPEKKPQATTRVRSLAVLALGRAGGDSDKSVPYIHKALEGDYGDDIIIVSGTHAAAQYLNAHPPAAPTKE